MKQHHADRRRDSDSRRKPHWIDECLMLLVVGISVIFGLVVSRLNLSPSRWVADGIGIIVFVVGALVMRRWRGWP